MLIEINLYRVGITISLVNTFLADEHIVHNFDIFQIRPVFSAEPTGALVASHFFLQKFFKMLYRSGVLILLSIALFGLLAQAKDLENVGKCKTTLYYRLSKCCTDMAFSVLSFQLVQCGDFQK